MPVHTALVAGATGATAKRLVELLVADPAWRVVGLCRKPPPPREGVTWVSADLTSPADTRAKLAAHPGVTHVFYCSRASHGESGVESVAENTAMLRTVVEAAEATAPGLAHVHLIEGGKWYGMHIGAMPTPAREDDPRHLPPNFYYDQQDYLAGARQGKDWTWSASRPGFITDYAPERARNLVSVLGAWAAICRETGMALDYPGKPEAYTALSDITDATQLARAMRFMAVTPACADRAFNVTNGEPIRWCRFWPRLAEMYGLKVGSVRPMRLAEWMADKEPVWQRIVAKHGLVPRRLDEVALWSFADFALNQGWDVFYSSLAIRIAGFADTIDTEATILTQIQQYRDARILP
jgi:nucleoside-diphosphate-sugar epimerase